MRFLDSCSSDQRMSILFISGCTKHFTKRFHKIQIYQPAAEEQRMVMPSGELAQLLPLPGRNGIWTRKSRSSSRFTFTICLISIVFDWIRHVRIEKLSFCTCTPEQPYHILFDCWKTSMTPCWLDPDCWGLLLAVQWEPDLAHRLAILTVRASRLTAASHRLAELSHLTAVATLPDWYCTLVCAS